MGEDFYPEAFDRNITDDIVRVGDAEAFEMTRRLAGEEGLLVGGSSGMAVASAIKYALANDLDENQIMVVLAPDSGRSYLEKIFDDDWMRANGYGDVVDRTTKPSAIKSSKDLKRWQPQSSLSRQLLERPRKALAPLFEGSCQPKAD